MNGNCWRTENEILRRYVQQDIRNNARQAVSRKLSKGDLVVFIGGLVLGIIALAILYSGKGEGTAEPSAPFNFFIYWIVPFFFLVVLPIRAIIDYRISRFKNHTKLDAIKRVGQWIHYDE